MELKTPSGQRVLLTADSLRVQAGEKQILFDVSAVARSGRLLAVMGPSGSGKTTFLNTLSGRMVLAGGAIRVNGKPVSSRMRKSFGYVTQSDVFFPQLTLRQTVMFAARVKLPNSMDSKQRLERVKEVVASLQLEKCMDTIVGNFMTPGLSGGEKKRANVACEMLPNPDVLLLDEPTSGLDSSLAFTLIELLRDWATKQDKVVVMSIHQPSSQIFHQFDDLLLLTDGHVSYFGKQEGMVDYFGSIDVPFEEQWNPADYMLEVVKRSSESKSHIIEQGAAFSDLAAIQRATADGDYDEVQEAAFDEFEFQDASEGRQVSWLRQAGALTIRGFQLGRTRFFAVEPLVRTGFIGIFTSILWFQIDKIEDNIQDVIGCVFFVTTNLSFSPLFEAIMSYHEDIQVVKHERRAGMYQIGAYYVAKLLTEMPLLIAVPFLTLTIVFWSAGLGSFATYLGFVFTILINSIGCQGIGVFIGLLTDIPKANLTIAFIFLTTSLLLGGFFTTAIPFWLVWLKWLSFVRYCFHFCLVLVMQSIGNFECSAKSKFPSCLNATVTNSQNQTLLPTEEILRFYDPEILPMWANFGVIVGILAFFRIVGYLWLRFLKKA